MDTPLLQKPKTMAELLPGLSGIMSKDARQALTGLKPHRPTIAATRTTEKTFKPMTIAEMKADIKALKHLSPRKTAQNNLSTSTKKKWNSSVKVNKTISLTANRQMKNNTVRKALDFQLPKPKIPQQRAALNSRKTLHPHTPKFVRPEIKAKKSLHPQVEASDISGICHIEETPLLISRPTKIRMTIANKENFCRQPQTKISTATPKSSLRKRIMASRIPDTPLSNESWKSSCDESFLQNEKDIELKQNLKKVLTEPKASDMAKVSTPASTPFKEYRNVNEFFNNSSNDNSEAYQDNTIMCFDTNSMSKENNREESVIVSLCDMLNKATVSKMDTEKVSTDLDDLLELERQTANNVKMIENGIALLSNIKKSELKSLQSVRKLIHEKRNRMSKSDKERTVIETTKKDLILKEVTPIKSEETAKPCSVIKSCLKSPSYKIPKRMTSSVRKKVHYKSLPNIAILNASPEKDMGGKALNIYLKMKEHMNFLSTPAKKPSTGVVMDTPAIASHNLQKQLDKLYNDS